MKVVVLSETSGHFYNIFQFHLGRQGSSEALLRESIFFFFRRYNLIL
jgi:hypothetical protein